MEADEKVCPRCAENVKAAAQVCRYCGHQFVPQQSEPDAHWPATETLPATATAPSPPKSTAIPQASKIAMGIVGSIVLFFIAIVWLVPDQVAAPNSDASASAPTAPAPTPSIAVTSVELAQAYGANEVAAQQTYGDKTLNVTGVVQAIRLDMANDTVIDLDGVDDFHQPQADFGSAKDDRFAQLAKGQTITVQCTSITSVVATPMLSDCTLPQ